MVRIKKGGDSEEISWDINERGVRGWMDYKKHENGTIMLEYPSPAAITRIGDEQ